MRKQEFFIAVVFLVIFFAVAFIWFAPSGVRPAPDITFTTLKGEKLALKDLRGKPVLITFWATSCPSCVKEIPHLIELHDELNQKGLTIIGVAMPYDRPDHVMEMVKQKKMNYTIALDVQGEAVTAFGNIQVTPTSFLIDPKGMIVMHKIGDMDMKLVHDQITSMLATNL